MKIFITGASGFVGGHMTEALAPHHQVLAMARSEESAARIAGFGASPVMCSLGAVKASQLTGCDAIIHCAAFVEEWGTREQFWQGNVVGTGQLLAAAKEAGVSRFIHIGTEAALFDGHDLINIDETQPYPAKQRFLYSETKAEAERQVLAANSQRFATLSLRPRLVWGPRDTSVLPAVLRMAREGAWAWLSQGQALTSTTHIKNLVAAVEAALTRGKGGEAYFIADEGQRTIKEFIGALAKTQGVDLPERSLPGGVARGLAVVVEGAWRLFGIKRSPPMTRFAISMMSSTVTVNTEKAKRELDYVPLIGVAEGLAAMRHTSLN
jgi:nucleoside-diphosphate-sugar epimerase